MAEVINFNEYLKEREVFLKATVNIVENDEYYDVASLDLGFKGGIRSNEDAKLFFKMLRPTIAGEIFFGLEFLDGEVLSAVKDGKRVYTEMGFWRDIENGKLILTKIDVHENKNFKKMY